MWNNRTVSDTHLDVYKREGQYIENFEKRFFQLEKMRNTKYFIGLHSTKWVNEKTLIELSNFLKENPNIKLTVHVCESKQEIEYVKNKYVISPIELLYKHNLLNKNTLLIHCCYSVSYTHLDVYKRQLICCEYF